MLIKRLSNLTFLLILSTCTLAQYSFEKEVSFLNHLNHLKAYDDGLLHLNTIGSFKDDPGKADTLNFWKGKFYYNLKKLTQSIHAYDEVSANTPNYYRQAQFVNSIQLSYLGLYDSAYHQIGRFMPNEELFVHLKTFQQASISLLKRDYTAFDKHAENFTGEYYEFKDYEEDLIGIQNLVKFKKKKSPFLAGLFSTIVPGAGKIYAGKVGQGAMSLLISGIFGLQTWEAYRKDGVKSARFVIFGGLFSAFYVANIWGSVVTVRMTEIEFNDSANEAILVNMHVPLRVIFD